MWDVKGVEISPAGIDLTPVETLVYYDGPRIFACRDRSRTDGNELLAYCIDEDRAARVIRYLVVPTNDWLLAGLRYGSLTLREALSQPGLMVLDQAFGGEILKAWLANIQDIPDEVLPRPEVKLNDP